MDRTSAGVGDVFMARWNEQRWGIENVERKDFVMN